MSDLQSLPYNPYDFANPVSDEALFVGRDEERAEIQYYLEHAAAAPRPISLALIGARASGKTSLLNMTNLLGARRGFCVVRVDLSEADATSELRFFFKLFEEILAAACANGAFGGLAGKTYETYVDMVSTFRVPDSSTFCPFLFPVVYSKAMSVGNESVPVPDHGYRHDLKLIQSELGCPVLVLIDEGNVLGERRTILERLRNTFMNTSGFMLVLTGTQALFSVMDDVFSPIVRQFKKIEVREFQTKKETSDCIRAPLSKIGLDPDELFDFFDEGLEETHQLSGGRPYEIQLICHVMFRRVQSGKAKRMRLTTAALEEIREQLETSRRLTSRPLIQSLQSLTKRELQTLELICINDGLATLDQTWALEYVSYGESRWNRHSLQKNVQHLLKSGILTKHLPDESTSAGSQAEELLQFSGDDFDKVYAKYYARERGVALLISEIPLRVLWRHRVDHILADLKDLESLTGIGRVDSEDFVLKTARLLRENEATDLLASQPSFPLVDLYWLMVDHRAAASVPICVVDAVFPWMEARTWHYARAADRLPIVRACAEAIEAAAVRAQECGGELRTHFTELEIVPLDAITRIVSSSENRRLRRQIVQGHHERLVTSYTVQHDLDEASFHADMCLLYEPNVETWSQSNNIGYLRLAQRDFENACRLFQKATDLCTEQGELTLPLYNLAIATALLGKTTDAATQLTGVIDRIESLPDEENRVECLFVPVLRDGKLEIEECWNVLVSDCARTATSVLAAL